MCQILTQRWHAIWVKRIVLLATVVALSFAFQSSLRAADAGASTNTNASTSKSASDTSDTSTSDTSPDTSTPAVYDLENEPSQCIGLLPRPGCGKKPEDAGERGGALQYAVFGLMIAGLGVIGLGMVRGIKKQKPQL